MNWNLALASLLLTIIWSNIYFRLPVGLTEAQAQSPTVEVQQIDVTREIGQVLRVNNNQLTVQTTDGVKEYTVPEDVAVMRGTDRVGVNQIQPDDGIAITRSQNGEVLSVDVVPKEAIDVGKWVLPTIVGLTLLVGAGLIISRSRRDHIKTDAV